MTEPVRMVPIEMKLAKLSKQIDAALGDWLLADNETEASEADQRARKRHKAASRLRALAASGVKETPAGDGE